MKTKAQFLLMISFIISITFHVNAQGKGHHKGYQTNHHTSYRGHDGDNENDDDDNDDHHDRHYSEKRRSQVHHVYAHRHDRYCHHAPVVVHHYPSRSRYIYYRDYDVYYDHHRQVYISYSGKNWGVSAGIPLALQHVNRGRAVRMAVDYDQDNFTAYLETRRPVYRVYRGD